jgi:uncharacterized repeat protein (TIGR01451 family)
MILALAALSLLGGPMVLAAEPASRMANPRPSLALEVVGPTERTVGQAATYTLTVENRGNTGARQVVLTHELPAGFRYVSSDGGRFDAKTRRVTWTWNELAAGSKQTVRLNTGVTIPGGSVDDAGQHWWLRHKLTARDQSGTRGDAEIVTRIDDAPAAMLKEE